MGGFAFWANNFGEKKLSVLIAATVLEQEAAALIVCKNALGDDFKTAVSWLVNCGGRVITCGIGKSGHIARKTAGTLSSTGTPSGFLHAAEAVHGDLGMVTANDVVILYSQSGETDEIVNLFAPIRAQGAKTILITGRPRSTAGRAADLVLDTRVTDEACTLNLAPTTSTTVMLALSDALAIAVMTERGFGREDFAKFHPSGALGKRLTLRVRDVMRPFPDIATVKESDTLIEVMRSITKAGVGAACVIDSSYQLKGFISDGDLRRQFIATPDRMDRPAKDVMNPNPSTIEPDLLAFEALEAFQGLSNRGGEMPVLEGTELIGLLMLKDLLRCGIV